MIFKDLIMQFATQAFEYLNKKTASKTVSSKSNLTSRKKHLSGLRKSISLKYLERERNTYFQPETYIIYVAYVPAL